MGAWTGEAAKAYYRNYYLRNKEKRLAQRKEWYAKNKEENLTYQKAWRAENADKKNAYDKAWRAANMDKIRARRSSDENRAKAIARAKRWARANPEQVNEQSRIKRARLRGATVEKVDFLVVAERDKWVCGICHIACSRDEATLDHIQPLSKGGEHSMRNVQLAHFVCNSRKGATWPWPVNYEVEEVT